MLRNDSSSKAMKFTKSFVTEKVTFSMIVSNQVKGTYLDHNPSC